MKRAWLGVLLVTLPLSVLAQKGPVLREADPVDEPPPMGQPADGGVTAAPLAPPDQDMPPDDQTLGRAVHHDLAAVHDHRAGAGRFHFLQDVGGEQDRLGLAEALDELPDLMLLVRIQTVGRLV